MRVYIAGPLFTPAERDFIDALAARLRAAGHSCFVPHEHVAELAEGSPAAVFTSEYEQLALAELVVAVLNGPELSWRAAHPDDPIGRLDPYIRGRIESVGAICTNVDDLIAAVDGRS